jgi:hypothetical protein
MYISAKHFKLFVVGFGKPKKEHSFSAGMGITVWIVTPVATGLV